MKLPIEPMQQETSFSCVASVLQMLDRYYTGFNMTHDQAIALTRCNPDGAELNIIGKILRRKRQALQGIRAMRRALRDGHPIATDDNETYADPHAILVHGETPKGFWFVDPSSGEEVWKPANWFRASTEFLIFP